MRYLVFTFAILFSANAFAHGSIELIECHDSESMKVLRGEAQNKKNVFKFTATNKGKKVWEKEGVKLALSDTVEAKTVIENIKFDAGKEGSAHLKINETPLREIRNGKGKLKLAKAKFEGDFSCYAVY